jgi:hypothetical protein
MVCQSEALKGIILHIVSWLICPFINTPRSLVMISSPGIIKRDDLYQSISLSSRQEIIQEKAVPVEGLINESITVHFIYISMLLLAGN